MPATLRIVDLSPRFLKFYELARDADPETRWKLWEEHYGFAAVPPTDYGKTLARKLLDDCWHRYPEVMDAIRHGAAGFRPDPHAMLEATARLLEFDGEIEVQFTTYVGNLERNAFAATVEGRSYVNFPLESNVAEWAPVYLPHELTHVLHERLCGGEGGWMRSVATALMQEGLAIWASKLITPDRDEWQYVSMENPEWVDRCREREASLFEGIRARLSEASEDALQTFIFGPGPAGLAREVYWAGYRAVGHLLAKGYRPAQLARLHEGEFTPLIEDALAELLRTPRG